MVKNSFLFLFVLMLIFVADEIKGQKLYDTPWMKTGIILGGSTGLVGTALYIEDRRGPLTIADIAALNSESVNSFDRPAIENFSISAGNTSDYFKDGILLAPLTLFLSGQGRENAKEVLYMYAEILAVNSGLTAVTKAGVGRYRPYAYNPNVDLDIKLTATTRRAFFSGHVSHVASLSFFTATVFDDLYPDSDYKYVIWAGAITAPAITGYLRIKAGRHYRSDVIMGYGVGALIGYFIPELHKITRKSNVNIIGSEGGMGLLYDF